MIISVVIFTVLTCILCLWYEGRMEGHTDLISWCAYRIRNVIDSFKSEQKLQFMNRSVTVMMCFIDPALLYLLLRPRERWQSMVMSTSVCVCVCLSVREHILPNHMRDLYQIFCACCLWPWLGPPPAGWQNPKGKGQFWGFLPHWQHIVQHSIWDPHEYG